MMLLAPIIEVNHEHLKDVVLDHNDEWAYICAKCCCWLRTLTKLEVVAYLLKQTIKGGEL